MHTHERGDFPSSLTDPRWMAELLNKALKFVKEYKIVIVLGVVALLIVLLEFAKANPGKIPFLDPLVEKIFGGGRDGDAMVLDLTNAPTFQDDPSLHDKQAPVNDMSFVDSKTGRPWSECGHYAHEWWGVDLGTVLDVRHVILQGRLDCCEKRLQGVDIYLGSVAGTYVGNTKVKTNVSVDSQHSLQVNINASGRYLYFRRPHESTSVSAENGLTICKLYVFSTSLHNPNQ